MAKREDTKQKVELLKQDLQDVLVTMEEKELQLREAVKEDEKALAAEHSKTVIAKAKKVAECNELLIALKSEAVEIIRKAIKTYLTKSVKYQREMAQAIDDLQTLERFIDVSQYAEEDIFNVNFALHRRHVHKSALTLKALISEVFHNENERVNMSVNALHGIPFLEDPKRNKWLK
ncbi:hypothetical protein [Fundidesulfovibrio putealis]|uniref:hypothetical protein n=1 Tax=Fundidesulfovibrio putealis TaxID=270496 RepID=UPI0012EBB655|nr:hypothetical protein [Fundidesulfovibrio putealis]